MVNKNNNNEMIQISRNVLEMFRNQNPQGYFNLLYLITENNASLKDETIENNYRDIADLRKTITELNQDHEETTRGLRSNIARLQKQLRSTNAKNKNK
tara:strand:+ start:2468 stop:2761 length:294 start_codon:yes stop_codon:yes gene_type:complete